MSRYTYAGEFKNPTEDFIVKPVGKKFAVFIRTKERDARGAIPADRRHSNGKLFAEPEEAEEWIEGLREFFEEDFDDYLEENHDSIAAMDRYEQFKSEF